METLRTIQNGVAMISENGKLRQRTLADNFYSFFKTRKTAVEFARTLAWYKNLQRTGEKIEGGSMWFGKPEAEYVTAYKDGERWVVRFWILKFNSGQTKPIGGFPKPKNCIAKNF